MRIKVDYLAMGFCQRQPQKAEQVMRDLGIKYLAGRPEPIADCWIFDGVDPATVPAQLPAYVLVLPETRADWTTTAG